MPMVLEVTRQGYNKWLKSHGKPYKHEALLALIKQVLEEDEEKGDNYGVRRVFLALRNNKDYTASYSKVCRVCRENRIKLPKKRKPNSLTEADKEAQKSEILIKQDFTAEKPNEKWLSDITKVP